MHGIVAQGQGHIWVESEPGRGAAFRILLPEAPGKGPETGGPRRVSIEEFRPARILVVDDDELVRKLVVRTLVSEGYDVLQARNGRQAFEFLQREQGTIDLVVSDVVMPILGGRQYSERLTEEYPDLPIVWMSGYPRDGVFPGHSVAEGQPFLQKPIPSDVLISTVRDLVMARRLDNPGTRP